MESYLKSMDGKTLIDFMIPLTGNIVRLTRDT